MDAELQISDSLTNIAVSITPLFTGVFVVATGGLADQLGRVRMANVGLVPCILGSLLIAISPAVTVVFLMSGRIVQCLSGTCIMPATLALMKDYFDGKDRQARSAFGPSVPGGHGLLLAVRRARSLFYPMALDLLDVDRRRRRQFPAAPRHS
jgi:MFS transporter, DHA2 family, multidrug resistance protein